MLTQANQDFLNDCLRGGWRCAILPAATSRRRAETRHCVDRLRKMEPFPEMGWRGSFLACNRRILQCRGPGIRRRRTSQARDRERIERGGACRPSAMEWAARCARDGVRGSPEWVCSALEGQRSLARGGTPGRETRRRLFSAFQPCKGDRNPGIPGISVAPPGLQSRHGDAELPSSRGFTPG
jgi:hypothetical protein